MPKYQGSCHCGAVKFEVESEVTELTTCDCSICVKKNAVMTKVHERDFTLHTDWSAVSEYQWNMKIARHFFCGLCGIYTFHRKRAQPDHFGVNIFYLDDFDHGSVPVRATEGESMSVRASDDRAVWPGPRVP